MNDNDKVKEVILKFLYDKSVNARSENTRRETEPPIERHVISAGFTKALAIHNLSYLVDAGWVKKESESYSSPGFGKGKTIHYRITDRGINHFEGISQFQRSRFMTGINIVNVNGVTVVGDNNFVQTDKQDLYKVLDLIKEEFSKLDTIDDAKKVEVKADIETIQAQLAKAQPLKQVVSATWAGLSFLSTIEGITALYERAKPMIDQIIT